MTVTYQQISEALSRHAQGGGSQPNGRGRKCLTCKEVQPDGWPMYQVGNKWQCAGGECYTKYESNLPKFDWD